ncbi:hypothetical protein GAY31_13815 [Azospirillum brasilense]|nr:hypothetical protein [Azospirillum brasilense]
MMQLRELRLVGPDAEPAVVTFQGGPNVVSGASNTGKSYILRCVDYILGAERMTKTIEEAAPYNRVLLQIENSAGEILTLDRSLNGGDIAVHRRPISELSETPDEVVLWKRDNSRRLDLSTRLMAFCGMPAAFVRANVRGEKQRLSLRMIAHLFIVDENAIIEERSPLEGDGGYDQTARSRAFSFMLTGQDDSAITAAPDPKVVRTALNAKLEVIEGLLAPVEKRLAALPADDRTAEERVELLDRRIADTSAALADDEQAARAFRTERAASLAEWQRAESQIVALGQIRQRFELLAAQYDSDLERLNFITEGSHYLDQLQVSNCPMCGQPLGADHLAHDGAAEASRIQRAARGEAAKILGLRKELTASRRDIEDRIAEQRVRAERAQADVGRLERLIQERTGPRLRALREDLRRLVASRVAVADEQSDRIQAERLRAAQREAEEAGRPTSRRTWSGFDPMALAEFCGEIERVLEQWAWPRPGRVSFDLKANDILVDGKPRQSNGKGVRAILHAAFNVGLLRYAAAKGRPHPGFLLLDSPLTTYKQGRTGAAAEASPGDDVGSVIEQAFFKAMSETPHDLQIIVLENKNPAPDLRASLRHEYFAGVEGLGRRGFIPAATVQGPPEDPTQGQSSSDGPS